MGFGEVEFGEMGFGEMGFGENLHRQQDFLT